MEMLKIFRESDIKCECHNSNAYLCEHNGIKHYCLISLSKILNMRVDIVRYHIANEIKQRNIEMDNEIFEMTNHLYDENDFILSISDTNNIDYIRNVIKITDRVRTIKKKYYGK